MVVDKEVPVKNFPERAPFAAMGSAHLAVLLLLFLSIVHIHYGHPAPTSSLASYIRRGRGGSSSSSSSGRGSRSGSSAAKKITKSGRKKIKKSKGSGSDNEIATTPEPPQPPCFPGDAHVVVKDRGEIAIRDLRIGDCVQVGTRGDCSRVYAFSHRLHKGTFDFLAIETVSGQTLRATAGHFVYVNDNLRAARDVKPGDVVWDAHGKSTMVKKITSVRLQGLFNPHTISADIVVDGLRASTFTEAVKPTVANALLTPIRAGFAMCRFDVSGGTMEGGLRPFVELLRALGKKI